MHINKKIILLIATLGMSFPALATDTTGNMTTNAQIQAACSVSVDNMNFGTISYKNTNISLAKLATTCSKGIVGTGSLSTGNSSDYARYMTNGTDNSDHLKYDITMPGGLTLGDGSGTTGTLSITGTGVEVQQWLSGTLPKSQYLTPGNYSDNLTFTLSY